MSDYTDLIARLRQVGTFKPNRPAVVPLCNEAANALEAAAERERELEAMVRSWKEQTTHARAGSLKNMERTEQAEAECAAWRRATSELLYSLHVNSGDGFLGRVPFSPRCRACADGLAVQAESTCHYHLLSSILSTPSPGAALLEELAQAKAEKNEAYRQRNVLVRAIANLYPSGIRRTDIEGWSEDWHGCCLIDLPSGQISYHYHDSQAALFADLPPYTKPYDGHDKETVHARLRALAGETREEKP